MRSPVLRFRLRTLLAAMCFVAGGLGVFVHPVHRRAKALAELRDWRVNVTYTDRVSDRASSSGPIDWIRAARRPVRALEFRDAQDIELAYAFPEIEMLRVAPDLMAYQEIPIPTPRIGSRTAPPVRPPVPDTVDLARLPTLSNLQELQLNHLPIADAAPIGELAKLRTLSLTSPKIASIEFAAKLTGLQRLALRGTSVSDLRPLDKLPYLCYLDISETRVSLEEANEFQLQHPTCEVRQDVSWPSVDVMARRNKLRRRLRMPLAQAETEAILEIIDEALPNAR